jgi:hypothetical protein
MPGSDPHQTAHKKSQAGQIAQALHMPMHQHAELLAWSALDTGRPPQRSHSSGLAISRLGPLPPRDQTAIHLLEVSGDHPRLRMRLPKRPAPRHLWSQVNGKNSRLAVRRIPSPDLPAQPGMPKSDALAASWGRQGPDRGGSVSPIMVPSLTPERPPTPPPRE